MTEEFNTQRIFFLASKYLSFADLLKRIAPSEDDFNRHFVEYLIFATFILANIDYGLD
jgi:hypothetical protein